jgi:pilus assembly protein Flp/PilA
LTGSRRARQASRKVSRSAALPRLRTGSRCITSVEEFMSMLLSFVKSFVREEEGQDLLEYALLVALIALVAIGAVGAAGGKVSDIFNAIAGQLNT